MDNIQLNLSSDWNNTSWWTINTPYYFEQYKPLVQEYYYNWYPYWTNDDKLSKAFKLAQLLIEKKLIKEPEKVKNFIELVNSLVEIL